MKHQIDNYISDNENPIYNFELALEYEKIGQTSSAFSFFLRCAERSHNLDMNLSYECLIHMGKCYDTQGGRKKTVNSCWKKALCYLPRRPEVYYYLCRLYNWNGDHDEAYTLSTIALEFCDFDSEPLRTIEKLNYKVYLLFEKALSSWWWGKVDECKETFLDLYHNHFDELPEYQRGVTTDYLKNKLKVI